MIADSFWGRERPDDWRSQLGGVLYDIRDKLNDRNAVFVAIKTGWALGVTSFRIPHARLSPINTLWRNEGNFVPEEELEYNKTPFGGKPVVDVRKALVHGHYLVGLRLVKVPGVEIQKNEKGKNLFLFMRII